MSVHEQAETIVRRLQEAGHEALFAGGAVRDRVMGRETDDIDIATSARPEEVQTLFPESQAVGAAFGVVLVLGKSHAFEVATFRTDGPTDDQRHPVSVAFCSAEEDVRRRDFTINGMLYDPVTGELFDRVGGRDDIARKLVRTIGRPEERFNEDLLRLLRAVRFAAKLDFGIEEGTYEAMRRMADQIAAIAVERTRDELLRIFTLPEGRGARGLRLLHDTGLLRALLPEVDRMAGVEQPKRFHPEGDVFEHTCMMLEAARDPSPELAMGLVLHDVGKPLTQTFEDRIRFDEHDRVGEEIARSICRRLRLSNEQTHHIVALVAQHMRVVAAPNMRPAKLKRLLGMDRFEEHLQLHRLDCLASHSKMDIHDFLKHTFETMPPEEVNPPPLIDGRDLIALGFEPGPRFKEILTDVRDRQLDGELTTREEALSHVRDHCLS